VFCLGRRSGKGVLAQVAAIYNATQEDYTGFLRRYQTRYIVVVATSKEQAQRFIRETVATLKAAVDDDLVASVLWDECTASRIVFDNHTVIEAMATSDRSTRGMAISMLIFDEAGHLQADSESVGAGKELYQALAPSMAEFRDKSYVLFTSTPMMRIGLFWEMYRNGTEKAEDGQPLDPSLFVVQRATWEVNNSITRDTEEIANAYRTNPEWAVVEYEANFMAAGGAFLDPLDIIACQRKEGILPPGSHRYHCAIDPAFQRDAFAMAIAHQEGDRIVVDGVWSWGSTIGYENLLDEVAAVAKVYGVKEVRTDQYAGPPIVAGLAARHLSCNIVPWDNAGKWAAFSQLKSLLRTRLISLPRDPRTETELMNLIATATATGLVRIAASGDNHDDRASCLAALADMLGNDAGPIVIDKSQWTPVGSHNPFDWPGSPFLPD
jgi:phage terminase large subunit-like protein